MKQLFILIFFSTWMANGIFCQSCVFDEHLSKNEIWPIINRQIINQTALSSFDLDVRSIVKIPVVIHIVWKETNHNISDLQVKTQLDALNRDFLSINPEINTVPDEFRPFIGNAQIQFCLASTDPFGQPSNGITRTYTVKNEIGNTSDVHYSAKGGKDAWDTRYFLNIWVCELQKGILGYSTPPGIGNEEEDGIVIDFRHFGSAGTATNTLHYNLGRTLTHEIGHYLGLLHPWGINKGDCDEGDYVEDTPMQLSTYKGCPTYPQSSCGTNEMFMNFMNETHDECMAFFTKGQVERMHTTLNFFRHELLVKNNECPIKEQNDCYVQIFPNPAKELFNIKYSNPFDKEITVSIWDAHGRVVEEKEIYSQQYYAFSLSNFPNGTYFVCAPCPTTGKTQCETLIIHR